MQRSIGLLHILLSCGAVLAAAQPGSAVAQVPSSWETPEYFRSGALAQIDAAAAYQLGFTGLGVVIGIADSGLDARHPEFWGRVEPGYDFTARVPILPGELHDRDGHGTHVAGVAAGARDGIEMHGVAFDATVRPARLGDGGVYGLDEYLTRVWPYFIQQGVSIINASYGIAGCNGPGLSPCNVTEYTLEDIARDYAKIPDRARETAAAGVLMVVAAGNASHPSPDPLSGLPYLYPELQDNWISVVAVDSTNTIASFSNRCGVAREWCIAAPGEQIYSAYPLGRGSGTDNSYKVMDGTSQAAPVVSGVAALVKQAFPWFTAYDLQQTLFTTATDLGAPGVDDIYGWGLVNAGKAVRGYGMFTQAVTLDTKGYSSTFSNDISGPGGLVKQGAGTLTLEGGNTYAGGTTVAGGTLAVDGTVAGPVDVRGGAVLAGRGVVGSVRVEAGGGVAPGNRSGRLFVNGDLTFSTGAVYIVALSAVEASRAMVAGTATLAGAVRPELLGSSVARSYTILSAGNLDGTFDGVDTSAIPGFAAALGYAGNDVLLRLTAQLGAIDAGSLGQNQRNVAGALNDWFNGGGTLPPAFAGLFGLTGDQLNGALSQASGEARAALPHATFLAMTQFLNMVFDPHAAGRSGFSGGAEGPGALGYAAEGSRSQAALEAYAAVTPRAAVSFAQPRWSVWGGGYGGLANVRGDGALGTAQTTSRAYGFALGADRRLASDTVLGFALAGGGTSFGLAGGLGGGTSELFQASLYGRQHFGAG